LKVFKYSGFKQHIRVETFGIYTFACCQLLPIQVKSRNYMFAGFICKEIIGGNHTKR